MANIISLNIHDSCTSNVFFKEIICIQNYQLCQKFMFNFMLHPTLWANCPYGIHNILSVESMFKFLNEAKVMTMHFCFTTWILHSINQTRKQNSKFQFMCFDYKCISAPKKLKSCILHIKYKFSDPNHVSSNIGVICKCIVSLKHSICMPIPCNLIYTHFVQIPFTCFDCINEITNDYPS